MYIFDVEQINLRETEREELLHELRRMVLDQFCDEGIADEMINEQCFYWGLLTGAVTYASSLTVELEQEGDVFYVSALSLFKGGITARIEAFTPVATERKWFAAKLAEYAMAEICKHTFRDLQRLAIPPERAAYLKQIGLDVL